MIILGFSFVNVALGVLYTSLILIVGYISYKKLLQKFNKDVPDKASYCELNPLEKNPASGLLEFYFTTSSERNVSFEILNESYTSVALVTNQIYQEGQHILRFDSTQLENGNYFYQLKTENQQTIRKMVILN
jgi:hypothetical protein